jgi:hypothetical protein
MCSRFRDGSTATGVAKQEAYTHHGGELATQCEADSREGCQQKWSRPQHGGLEMAAQQPLPLICGILLSCCLKERARQQDPSILQVLARGANRHGERQHNSNVFSPA